MAGTTVTTPTAPAAVPGAPAAQADNTRPFHSHAEEGWRCGPWRRPSNNSRHEAGTIHADETAQRLGFRGGPVAGSIHLESFVPLLTQVFGAAWPRTGSLSVWFHEPTLDGEPVCAQVAEAAGARRAVRLLAADGRVVLSGTASAGLDDHGALRQRLAAQRPGAAPRILAPLRVGFRAAHLPTRVPRAEVERRRPLLTELPATPGPGADDVAPMAAAVHALRVFEERLPIARSGVGGGFVGLFGGIEWQWLDGPLQIDHPYEVRGEVVAISDSPRSEMLWTETVAHDPARGVDAARMLMLSRLLKNSSPLWTPTPPDR